ncbi:hypothetical protein P8C59_006803 [Phyllachora maydis]|uniref:Senescence domain-containing protein n=1 Tax=Phyllachora maydis TaxID=1825666 RepID=A0AAD9I8W9_9PEZI|nr:hypothetical protein P8C59_006803 [Phyllachora maydis]
MFNMASGHYDPKLLYAITGVKASHIANGKEESLTPAGPQTLSLLMVPTSSAFADPHVDATGSPTEEDFYLHLHLPPELDLPLPATTQIYHQPPTSYLIPRWDMGPGSGAFTRIEFPPVGSRPGIQEDVDTFETILAQCTAFLERAPPPTTGLGSSAKAREAADNELPPYNPSEFKPGEGYVRGSHSVHPRGQIVLVDEEDGSVIGELTDGFQVVEDSKLKPGSKDPVEISLPAEGAHAIKVAPASDEYLELARHPAYRKSKIVSNAAAASRLIVTGSEMVSKVLVNQADSFAQKTQPAKQPLTFKPSVREHIRRINTVTVGAKGLSTKAVGKIGNVAQNLGASLARSKKDGGGRGYDPDGQPLENYKPGLLNKSLMAFNTVVDGVEQAGRNLLTSGSSAVTTVVAHKWGPEAGEVAKNMGGGVKNVALVYVDVAGVSRRAILKSVAKGMVIGRTANGQRIIVGGNDGGAVAADEVAGTESRAERASPHLDMLHEILLSLSGQPSPLLRTAASAVPDDDAAAAGLDRLVSPPERALLARVARLSHLHAKLLAGTAQTAAEHPSTICRAVAAAIEATHLAAFQRKVLEVEAAILRQDAALVGAYDIVPLTAVVGEFDGWTRRMEWLWDLAQFMEQTERASSGERSVCTGAALIDRLRGSLQTGFRLGCCMDVCPVLVRTTFASDEQTMTTRTLPAYRLYCLRL